MAPKAPIPPSSEDADVTRFAAGRGRSSPADRPLQVGTHLSRRNATMKKSKTSTLLRMDNVGIIVDDLEAAITFFVELGLQVEGQTTVEGPWVRRRSSPSRMRR